MSQTILIEDNPELRDIYALNLNNLLNTDVIHRKNADDAINLLKILPSVDLIITREKIADEMSAYIMSEFLQSESSDTPMIILGESKALAHLYSVIPNPVSLDKLLEEAGRLLGFDAEANQAKKVPDFISINARYFLNLNEVPCDVYIRIKKSPTEFQFVKRIHVKDYFVKEDIEKYMAQGLKEFFIPKDFRVNFTKYVTNQIIKKLDREDLPADERFRTNADTYDFVRDYINKFGLDDTVIELTETTINSINKSISGNPMLANFLEMLKKNKVGYAYQHCHLISLLSFNILKQLDWGTPDQFDKMCFIAFFHDITLSNEDMMKIGNSKELEESNLSAAEKEEVMNHAKKAAELIQTNQEAPLGTDIIIMQHHGDPNGYGFSEDYSYPLSPLAMVLIVCEEFINEVFLLKKALTLKDVFERLHAKFNKTAYDKIVSALEKSLSQKASS